MNNFNRLDEWCLIKGGFQLEIKDFPEVSVNSICSGKYHSRLDGSGIRVGIISDSFNSLGGAAADIENGELPGEQNPFDRTHIPQIFKQI